MRTLVDTYRATVQEMLAKPSIDHGKKVNKSGDRKFDSSSLKLIIYHIIIFII